ncbi:flagellar basal body rod protein FlgB [Pseudomonas sp. BGr12]|uniref:flagellar basal body rod protein FlgB n=1 Tax=unclassified Pseudomonas TaxID=196821 RepID=UPI0017854561|nr:MULTISPECIES: flagellar basal body rod protein FlgB [unclassified Pseudomonas]MBD9502292.1 flagellar basal body rod protein FlgB [Pseudomonas sp. PDM17]MBD9577156.1 flagellar basal body rod protein FlgB [Pseudomonas sp. PDM23]MBD9671271.1 flagellar basal body rod protein FlgB [Pseudomonas sp. PDM21]MDL2429018.1 flagellar basal body rod protein FlgB [Pseudomonas sp. BJa5]
MSIRFDETLGIHERALSLHMQRSEILASNLANEDTPGFKARDIDFAAEMQRQDSSGVLLASAGTNINAARPDLKYRIPNQPSQDGNSVELSTEQAEFSRNAMDFQTSLTFLTLKFRGLKQAIEGR